MAQKVLGIVVAVIAGVIGFSLSSRLFSSGSSSVTEMRDVAEPAAVPGWKRHTSEGGRFSIHLPVEFTTFDPESPDFKRALAETLKNNPEGAIMLDKVQTQANFVFWAFDLKNMQGSFARNINANVTRKQPKPTTPAELEKEKRNLLAQLPDQSQVFRFELVELPTGRAIMSDMQLVLPGISGVQTTRSFSYVVSTGSQDVTITFTCLPNEAETFGLLADKAMRTLRPLR